jgi:hypothetical protein
VNVAQVEPGRSLFTSTATPVSMATSKPAQIDRVLGSVPDQPAGRVAEAARGRVPHRVGDPRGELVPRRALAGVERDLHPVELGEDVVGEVERAVGQDVALAAAQDAERCQHLVRGGDLLRLAAELVGIEPGDDPDVVRVVADREAS